MAKLNPAILKKLQEKSELSIQTIRNNIWLLRKDYPGCTINAAAQLFARQHDFSIMQKLSLEDKKSLPNTEIVNPKIKLKKKLPQKKDKITPIIVYDSEDYFVKGHIKEVNRAYSKGCYTCVYILARKIIENLIREILHRKFPPVSEENRKLYFNVGMGRFHDFSVILKNLYDKRQCFDFGKKEIIERLYQITIKFKDDSNDKVHSWYHLVENEKEIINLDLQQIIELIKKMG